MILFSKQTISSFADSFAKYLPGGRVFSKKNVNYSGLRNLIAGFAEEASRASELLNEYNSEFYPDATVNFIEEWERVLSIPDECFSVEGESLETRQQQVLVKLAKMHVQTAQDFEDLAAVFGLSVTVVGGKDPLVSPAISPDKTARFTIVILYTPLTGFTYTFPIIFGSDAVNLLTCVFEKIRPANCQVLFQSV